MSRRQQWAWCFAAGSVPAVMVCAGRAWTWVLAGCAAAAVFYFILWLLRRQNGLALTEVYPMAFGAPFGRALLALTAVWQLLALANTVTGAAAAFPEGGADRLAPFALSALAAWAAFRGTKIPARCAAVAAPVLAGLYLVLLLAALPDVKIEWCRTWGGAEAIFETVGAMLLPTAALFLARRNEARSSAPAEVLAIMLLAPAAMAVVTAGCLSPEVVREERLAFYTLTKTISILPVMERFEPVLSAALFLGMFCMAALLADSCAQTASRAAGRRKKKWEVWAVCAAALALSKTVRAMPEAVWSAGAVAFWGLAPILAQVVVGIKKVKKKAKKGLTNAGDFGNIAERSREGSRSDVRLEQNRRKDEKSS